MNSRESRKSTPTFSATARTAWLVAALGTLSAGASAQSMSSVQNFDALSNGALSAPGWTVTDTAVNVSFIGGPTSADKFLEFLSGSAANYSFTLGSGYLHDLSIAFSEVGWVSENGMYAATVTLSGPSGLIDTRALAPQFIGAGAQNDYAAVNPPNSPSGDYAHSFSGLAGGTYVLGIDTLGAQGRKFRIDNLAIDAIAQPVPEPGAWAMMAAGLAVLATTARRRRGESTKD